MRKPPRPEAAFTSSESALPRTLQLPTFQLFLAVDAMARPRHSLKPFGIDVFATRNALSKVTLANPRQCSLHHLQQLAFVVALMKEEFFGVGTRGTIRDVLRNVLVSSPSVFLRTVNAAPQLLVP